VIRVGRRPDMRRTASPPGLVGAIRFARRLHGFLLRHRWEQRLLAGLHLVQLLGVTRDRRAQLRLLTAWHLLSFKASRGVLANLQMRIRFTFNGQECSAVVGDVSELEVLREIFVGGEYELEGDLEPKVILDVGSNVGFSALYFHERFPSARIIAVEPEPHAYSRLRRNTERLSRLQLVNAAVSDHDGEVTLYCGSASWAASTVPRPSRTQQVSVRAVTLDALAGQLGLDRIDVLKLDIEGAEIPVLTSTSLLDRVGTIVFEYHREYADITLWELLDRLDSFQLCRMAGDSESHATVMLQRRAPLGAD
jgi:FkbM family methyltransferase